MGSRPCGKRCCPQAAPHGRAATPCAGTALAGSRSYQQLPLQAAALAIGLPLVASQRALPTPVGVTPASASYFRGQSCLLVATPARGFGHGRPPLRSYIPVFQIQMEKMKEVKRPSL
ncbi:hypothetical protein B296_00053378 [Ensete ventricosum]|uniref:Uncharacterized protein n=1 Tax=Ensete ventricosum TaxID=4639 RepID=A0A426XI81_ENSVE|nr:hypothetical protein B296_00053378 [Ensete ventricosum]